MPGIFGLRLIFSGKPTARAEDLVSALKDCERKDYNRTSVGIVSN